MKNMLSWVPFWNSGEKHYGLTDKDVAQFVSNMRRPQGNPDSHYLLACYYQEGGRYKEAIEEFEKVLLIDPDYVNAYNGMGVSYDLLGDFPMAIESYEKALELNPNLDYLHNNLGYSHLLQGNLDAAIDAFQKAIALNNQNRQARNNLGLAYARKGQFDQAMVEFKLAGDEARAYYNIAQLYYEKGLYNEAIHHYTTALILNPSFTLAQNGLEAARALARISQPAHENLKDKQQGFARDIDIEISNGNGVNQMAKRLSSHLKEKGFKIVRLTNADNFKHAKTQIYYKNGYHELAHDMAHQIPGIQYLKIIKELDRRNIQLKVLIGYDLIKHNKLFEDGQQS
jgi:tetratricopeptide (TPR) repeat protein